MSVCLWLQVLEKGQQTYQTSCLQILYCMVHYLDIASAPSTVLNQELFLAINKHVQVGLNIIDFPGGYYCCCEGLWKTWALTLESDIKSGHLIPDYKSVPWFLHLVVLRLDIETFLPTSYRHIITTLTVLQSFSSPLQVPEPSGSADWNVSMVGATARRCSRILALASRPQLPRRVGNRLVTKTTALFVCSSFLEKSHDNPSLTWDL